MPGILCSVYDPSDETVEPKWRRGLALVKQQPAHIVEQYSEPGFQLACIYHPGVCQGSRILVTEQHVLALYGNLYDDDLCGADGETLCRVLLDRFVQGGASRLQHLNGRYDIAIWDHRARVLTFISERFGANRHYALRRAGALHLACEVKALAVFLDHIEVDPAGLASMLTFGYHIGDLTILKDVKCLPNACHLECQAGNGHLHIDRYWNYPFGVLEPIKGTEDELAEALHGHLMSALKRQLRGVNKILLPISGGLDSRTMAGLLHQSGFSGEVLAYSYGQPSSRDVRYGRAIARKLGYRHVAIPTPVDFVTHSVAEDAWLFDAEWSAELHWAVRFAYRDPSLGDTSDYHVLSGMFGDIVLGSDRFNYRRKAGDIPLAADCLRTIYYQLNQEYAPPGTVLNLFNAHGATVAEKTLNQIVYATLAPIAQLTPFYALMRAEFEHRQRRHTGMVAQCIERDRRTLTPFLDTEVIEFALRIPYDAFYEKKLYAQMIRKHLPGVAAIPYAGTAQPISNAPIRAAIHWRLEKILRHLPRLRRHLQKRNTSFRFHDGINNQRHNFLLHKQTLHELAPPLEFDKAAERFQALLDGQLSPVDQVCAFLPAALFIRELNRRLAIAPDAQTACPD